MNKIILCGISGGIAVYKAVEVVSALKQAGHEVHVVMSPAATRFVAPLTFQAILGRRVVTEFFAPPAADAAAEIYPHIEPASRADLFVIMPATADMIAALAQGRADDVVCASALGLSPAARRLYCPAMHTHMWQNPAVQANAARLDELGWQRVGPGTGRLACGAQGPGRMVEPTDILAAIEQALAVSRALAGRRVLILSGPTREHLDAVRFISNASSGKMGQALALAAAARGAQVDFVTGPVDDARLPRAPGIAIHPVVSAAEMLAQADACLASADLIVFAAAVADYRPKNPVAGKPAKTAGGLDLALEPTPDIAATLCARKKPGAVAMGFALQAGDAEAGARAKLRAKKLDGIVINAPEAMGADAGVYQFLSAQPDAQVEDWGRLSKAACAARILDCGTR